MKYASISDTPNINSTQRSSDLGPRGRGAGRTAKLRRVDLQSSSNRADGAEAQCVKDKTAAQPRQLPRTTPPDGVPSPNSKRQHQGNRWTGNCRIGYYELEEHCHRGHNRENGPQGELESRLFANGVSHLSSPLSSKLIFPSDRHSGHRAPAFFDRVKLRYTATRERALP